ncbi:MAG: MFS transporter [Firmicutes bacterium]|nr:MFS transporter [Bacillota bacterium]
MNNADQLENGPQRPARYYIVRYAIVTAVVQFFIYKVQDPFYLQFLTTNRGLALPPMQFSYFVSLASLVCLVPDYMTGVLADRFGRRPTWAVGLLSYAVAMIWLSTVSTFVQAIGAAIRMGFSYAFTSGSPEAWVYDAVGQEGTRQAYGKSYLYSVPLTIAAAVVATLLGFLSSVRVPVLLSGLPFLATGFFVLTFEENRGERNRSWLFTLKAGFVQFGRSPILQLAAVQSFFMTLPVWVNTAWWVTYVVQALHLNASETALAWGVTALAGVVAGKYISGMKGVRYAYLIVYPSVVMAAAYVGMALTTSAIPFVGLVALALTGSYFRGSGFSLLQNSQITHERATALSFLNTLRSGFWFAAPPLWGALIAHAGLKITFAVSSAACLLSLLLLLPALRLERQSASGRV